MQKDGRTLAARSFVRSLNILLRFSRLYGLQHTRTNSQFDVAWSELETALTIEGGRSLLLASASSQLLIDGTPLGDSPAERSFAKLLSNVGLASITFFPDVTREELRSFVNNFPTGSGVAGEMAEQIKKSLEGMKGIHVNEVCFVPADFSTTQMQIASQLTSQALGASEQGIRNWLDDPQKLLEMIVAAEGSGKGGHGAGTGSGSGSGSGTGMGSGAASWSGTGSGPGAGFVPAYSPAGSGSGSGSGNAGGPAGVAAPASGSAGGDGREVGRFERAISPAVRGRRTLTSDLDEPLTDEKEVLGIINLLKQIASSSQVSGDSIRPAEFQGRVSSLGMSTQFLLRRALAGIAAMAPEKEDTQPLLLKLAEHLAVRYALERYERGDVRVNAVREMLSRLSHEVEGLRTLVSSHEKKLAEAGIAVQPYAEQLDQQFWAMVGEEKKLSVLLSDEAWCVPPRGVRAYVEELFTRKDTETAQKILHSYSSCINSEKPDARRRAALGISELADLYTVGHEDEESLFLSVIRQTAEQLCVEQDPEIQSLVNAAFVRLSEEAAASRCYPAVRQTLESLEQIEARRPKVGQSLRPHIGLLNRLPDFVEDVLRLGRVPEGLTPLLMTIPRAAMEFLVQRFGHCGFREDCDLLVAVAGELVPEGVSSLRETFLASPPPRAAETVGLLSRLDFPVVETELTAKISGWSIPVQDRTIRQIVAGGATGRWKLIMALFERVDAILQPLLVDEVGMNAGAEAEDWLLKLANQEDSASYTPYVRVKAIESLGRLKSKQAKLLLRDLADTRTVLRWEHPRELRVAALQALQKIDPGWVQNFLPQSGIDAAALALEPLERDPASHCIRQRRYPRLRLNHPLRAMTANLAQNIDLTIQVLNLGGGVGVTRRHLIPGSVVHLELRIGLRPARAIVLVRGSYSGMTGFEIAEMSMDDRSKLRSLLMKDGSSPESASTKNRTRKRVVALRANLVAGPSSEKA